MNLLLDTNVVLDVLLPRPEWLKPAELLWAAAESGAISAYLTANSIADIYYVSRRLSDRDKAGIAVDLCLSTFQIAPVDRAVLERARQLSGTDFEDNIQLACCERLGLSAIVTRDGPGFAGSALAVWTPQECVEHLGL